MEDRKRGEPMYIPYANPHPCLTNQGDNGWVCTHCGIEGPFEEVEKIACTYEHPICPHCGLTPICAVDCPGILGLLMDPRVYIAGQSDGAYVNISIIEEDNAPSS